MYLKWVGVFIAASFSGCACYVPVDLGDGGCADPDAGPTNVCTLGLDTSCADDPPDGGGYYGTCVQGPQGTVCGCVYGFEPSPSTGRCMTCRSGSTADTCQVCTPGDLSTCAPVDVQLPAGVTAGSCVQSDFGAYCACELGFRRNYVTGRCTPNAWRECTTDQSCNSVPGMSSLAGSCRSNGGSGTFCQCNEGFTLYSGKCARLVCWENKAGSCQAVNSDGSPASPGTCGSMSIEPGCSCQRTVKDQEWSWEAVCPAAGSKCSADGGTSRNCQAYNCGKISCDGFFPNCAAPDTCL